MTTAANLAALGAIVNVNGIVPGSVIQCLTFNSSTQISWSSQDVETYCYQAIITPKYSTSKIVAFAAVGGIGNSGSGRMSGRIRYNTTSSDTSGTQIAGLTQVALNSSGTSGLSAMPMTGISSVVGSTSTLYFKVTMVKGDSGGTMYVNQYGSESQITVMEIAQ